MPKLPQMDKKSKKKYLLLLLLLLLLLAFGFKLFSGSKDADAASSSSKFSLSSIFSFLKRSGGDAEGLPESFAECKERASDRQRNSKNINWECSFAVPKGDSLYKACADIGGNTYGDKQCSLHYYNPAFKIPNDYATCKKLGGGDGHRSYGANGKIFEEWDYCSFSFSERFVYPDNLTVARRLMNDCLNRSDGTKIGDACKIEIRE